ncbi:unnamed protein product [Pedinophyceae sp. YPF-701]|nr:unnamed protein product [Pedinophyceae sp. YPF-701]
MRSLFGAPRPPIIATPPASGDVFGDDVEAGARTPGSRGPASPDARAGGTSGGPEAVQPRRTRSQKAVQLIHRRYEVDGATTSAVVEGHTIERLLLALSGDGESLERLRTGVPGGQEPSDEALVQALASCSQAQITELRALAQEMSRVRKGRSKRLFRQIARECARRVPQADGAGPSAPEPRALPGQPDPRHPTGLRPLQPLPTSLSATTAAFAGGGSFRVRHSGASLSSRETAALDARQSGRGDSAHRDDGAEDRWHGDPELQEVWSAVDDVAAKLQARLERFRAGAAGEAGAEGAKSSGEGPASPARELGDARAADLLRFVERSGEPS